MRILKRQTDEVGKVGRHPETDGGRFSGARRPRCHTETDSREQENGCKTEGDANAADDPGESMWIPQVQSTDEVVGVLLATQGQFPTIRRAQKTVEVMKTQFIDKVVDIPVGRERIQERNVEDITDAHVRQVTEETTKSVKISPRECYSAGSEDTTMYSALQGDCCVSLDTYVGSSEDPGACGAVCP